MAGTGGGAFVATVFDVAEAEAAAGFWSFAPVTDGAANGERLVVVLVDAAGGGVRPNEGGRGILRDF